MMKRVAFAILVILFLAFWLIRDARAFDCIPKTATTPTAAGTEMRSASTPAGRAWGFFCQGPVTASAPQPGWNIQRFGVLNKFTTGADPLQVASSIWNAPDPLVAVNAAIKAQTVNVADGSQDQYEFLVLMRNVCIELVKPPYLLPAMSTLPADYCGPAPVPPGPKPDVWRALGSAIYTAANGKLVAPVAGAKATVGTLCDGTVTPIPGAVIYLPLIGGPATQVTSCKKATQ